MGGAEDAWRLTIIVFLAATTIALALSLPTVCACRPGEYEANITGQWVCIPAVTNQTTPMGGITAYYADSKTLSLKAWCLMENGCSIKIILLNATTGSTIISLDISLKPGETWERNITLDNTPPVLVNASINGVEVPLFIVPPYKPLGSPELTHPLIQLLYLIFAGGALLGVVLRGSGREAGIALILVTIFAPRLMIALGIQPNIAYIASGVALLAGIILAATWRD